MHALVPGYLGAPPTVAANSVHKHIHLFRGGTEFVLRCFSESPSASTTSTKVFFTVIVKSPSSKRLNGRSCSAICLRGSPIWQHSTDVHLGNIATKQTGAPIVSAPMFRSLRDITNSWEITDVLKDTENMVVYKGAVRSRP